MCFRRFVARFRKPIQVISDNASQFKLAKRTFDEIWKLILKDNETTKYMTEERIQWKFITQLSPWMGDSMKISWLSKKISSKEYWKSMFYL